MKRLALIAALCVAASCSDSSQVDREMPPREGIFISAKADCTFPPEKVYNKHPLPDEDTGSPDERWFARTVGRTSQHAFELYDTQEEKKYYIFHPNVEVELSELSFGRNSNYLSFIGSPWGVNGISEIFILDLNNLEHQRLGDLGMTYRHPQVVSDKLDLIFYEDGKFPAFSKKSLLELANRERITFWVGYKAPDGRITYMLKMEDGKAGFESFDASRAKERTYYKRFATDFSGPPGILKGEKPGEYYVFDRDAFRYSDDGTRLSSFDEWTQVKVLIENGKATAVEQSNVLRSDVIHALRPFGTAYEPPAAYAEYDEEYICLDKAKIK